MKKSFEAASAAVATTSVQAAAQSGTEMIGMAGSAAASIADQVTTAAAATVPQSTTEVNVHMDKMMKTAEEFVSFGQGNMEAFARSSQIWAAGVQDLGKHMAATTQAHMEHTVATFKALAGVKSLKEAIDLQSTLARNSVETAVAETGKLTDASLKLAEQTLAPITARVTLAMEKFGRTA